MHAAHFNAFLAFFMVMAVTLWFAPSARAAEEATKQPAAGLTGTWTWSFDGPGGQSMTVTLKLKQDGQKLTGTVSGFGGEDWAIEDGKATDAGEFSFNVKRDFGGQTMVTHYSGKLEGDKLTGKSETVFSRSFEAKRGQ